MIRSELVFILIKTQTQGVVCCSKRPSALCSFHAMEIHSVHTKNTIQKANQTPRVKHACVTLCLLFTCRPLGFYLVTADCGTIRVQYPWKRVLKGQTTMAAIQFNFTHYKWKLFPRHQRQTCRMCKCSRHERKWQRHLPSMLIKF